MLFALVALTLGLFEGVQLYEHHACDVDNEKRADCTRRKLSKVPQDLNKDIIELDLSKNEIKQLPNNSLKRYKNLICLRIQDSDLNTIQTSAFRGLSQLRSLYIGENKIDLPDSDLDAIFYPIRFLEVLDIRSNKPPKNHHFIRNLHHLRNLSIDLVSNFNTSIFKDIRNLTQVVFDKCGIVNMNNDTFLNMPQSIQEVHFRECSSFRRVELDFLKPFINLRVLSIHESKMPIESALQLLYPFQNGNMSKIDITRVNTGYFGRDEIKYPDAIIITSDMMKYLQTICVSTLILAENGIVDFENGSLLYHEKPSCFREIVLTGNRFSIISAKKYEESMQFLFAVVNLEIFDMSYNPLEYNHVEYIWEKESMNYRKMVHNLTPLETYKKSLVVKSYPTSKAGFQNSLEPSADRTTYLHLPSKLQIIRFSHYLSKQNINQRIVVTNASNLRYFDISYFKTIDVFPDIEFVGSHNLTYVDFSGLDSSLFLSNKTIPLLEHVCTLIYQNANLGKNLLGNLNVFKRSPKLEDLDISHNSIWTMPHDTLQTNEFLKRLNLDYNINFDIPIAVMALPRLKILNIRYNVIQTINETIRTWLDKRNDEIGGQFHLNMVGNVLRCTCETVDFIEWIAKTDIHLDTGTRNYTCRLSNGDLTDTHTAMKNFHALFGNCNNKKWLQIGISLLVSFVILVIPFALVVNFRWRIAFWIYNKSRKAVMRHQFRYDIYFSYGHDSLWWIQETLIYRLEQVWDLTTCLEDRDFLAGCYTDVIAQSIGESRNVIFVITEEFNNSLWGKYEIERTLYERHTGNLQNIIVITRGVEVQNVPAEIGRILKDAYLIEWTGDGVENAWDKLRIALFPKSGR